MLIHGAESLKDKRRVIQSLKDRLHREHLCSIAEVGDPDLLNVATMALAVVTREGRRAGEILDTVTTKLRELRDGELGEIDRQILHASAGWLGAVAPEEQDDATPDARPGPTASPATQEAPMRIGDPKSGDGTDAETDAIIHERALEADLIEQIEQADREDRARRGGDAA
ncbi:MAG: DUF503 domain-containing protein [Phycisphaeraceae bacterium]|nr:DUF503 domain-containing protein [Phycisphaeraceae bacterium]